MTSADRYSARRQGEISADYVWASRYSNPYSPLDHPEQYSSWADGFDSRRAELAAKSAHRAHRAQREREEQASREQLAARLETST